MKQGELVTQLVLEIFRINGRLLVEGDRLVLPFHQTSSRWQVLGALREGPLTVPGIGRAMGISRQSVQRLVDILSEEGLCEPVENPEHRKSFLFRLSARGEKLMDKIDPLQVAWANQLGKRVSEKDLRTALAVLRRLGEALA